MSPHRLSMQYEHDMSTTTTPADTLSVRILNAERLVWQGEALSVASVNDKGPFAILPQHARFLTLINDATVTITLPPGVVPDNEQSDEPSGTQTYTFHQAVLYVKDNVVSIYPQVEGDSASSVVS